MLNNTSLSGILSVVVGFVIFMTAPAWGSLLMLYVLGEWILEQVSTAGGKNG